MSMFKIWDFQRKQRKLVSANSLEELLKKGSDKLGYTMTANTVVLEQDGTEIEDSDEVMFFSGAKQPLILLKDGEVWSCDVDICSSQSEQSSSDISDPTSRPEDASPQATTSSTIQLSSLSHQTINSSTLSTFATISRTKSQVNLSTPLPQFSEYIIKHLEDGTIYHVWRQVINEAAQYYRFTYPEIGDRTEYTSIGMRMLERFPSIAHEGTDKWSHFTTCLSQRIRHLRWEDKRKNNFPISGNSETQAVKKARFVSSANASRETHSLLSTEEYMKHVDELEKQWEKVNTNVQHVHVLIKETFNNRRRWMTELPHGQIAQILEEYPCFTSGRYLFTEFLLLLRKSNCEDWISKMKLIYQNLLPVVPTKPEGSETEMFLSVWKLIESQTCYNRGKGKKTLTVIDVKTDVGLEEADKATRSPRESAPKLVVMINDGELNSSFIVGDGAPILINSMDMFEAVLLLIASYYVLDLEYPKLYSNMLGFMQQFVIGDAYVGQKSANFKTFVNKYSKYL